MYALLYSASEMSVTPRVGVLLSSANREQDTPYETLSCVSVERHAPSTLHMASGFSVLSITFRKPEILAAGGQRAIIYTVNMHGRSQYYTCANL